jgi:hypothetical protein
MEGKTRVNVNVHTGYCNSDSAPPAIDAGEDWEEPEGELLPWPPVPATSCADTGQGHCQTVDLTPFLLLPPCGLSTPCVLLTALQALRVNDDSRGEWASIMSEVSAEPIMAWTSSHSTQFKSRTPWPCCSLCMGWPSVSTVPSKLQCTLPLSTTTAPLRGGSKRRPGFSHTPSAQNWSTHCL